MWYRISELLPWRSTFPTGRLRSVFPKRLIRFFDRTKRRAPSALGVGSATAFLVVLLISSCSSHNAPVQNSGTLTVAAAADLQSAFGELGPLFQQKTGARVTFIFGSSGNLEKQIENGAPVDLFASASEEYLQQLASKGDVLAGTEQPYGIGRIVLVSSKASGLSLTKLGDLTKPKVKHVALANPEHAPYGTIARQALQTAGLWDQIKGKVVYGEDVRQALQFVQTGNADAGIVALSIANVPEVVSSPIEATLYQPLQQPIAVVKGTREEALAKQFIAFVNGPQGRPIMKRYGFSRPGEN